MEYRKLEPQFDKAVAEMIRQNLKAYHLDIPGTAYYDEGLDHLSEFYARPGRSYFVLTEQGKLLGGIGLAEFDGYPDCCELQKLYLVEEAKGRGLGYSLIQRIEDQARELGYRRIYLETHTSLQAALHIYQKTGYTEIDRPPFVVHSTMNRFYLKELSDGMLAEQAKALMESEPWYVAAMSNLSALIMNSFRELNWAGFYLMRNGRLTVGPFQGKPACIHIPAGKGVCGTAVEKNETILVPDVHLFPGHIACDSASASEIVIPIHHEGKVIGVLDIDSPVLNRFSSVEAKELEKIVQMMEEMLSWEERA